MKELSLADCYGHAGLSAESENISLRIEPVQSISDNLTAEQILDLVRLYFELPVAANTDWFADPIKSSDASFSMIANRREVMIIAMALLAVEVSVQENPQAVLALLVAHAFGNRVPEIYPQFIAMVSTAEKDLAITQRLPQTTSRNVKARALNEKLGSPKANVVAENDAATLNEAFIALNADSQAMNLHLAKQVNTALKPIRLELAYLREEKDMLWWLIGGQSTEFNETYSEMGIGRSAFLIGSELAAICQTDLGPHASEFLIKKALLENRTEKISKIKIESIPKLFSPEELSKVNANLKIDGARDLCFITNALSRAYDIGTTAGWKKKYDEDGCLPSKHQLEPTEVALQTFRETLLMKAIQNGSE